MCGICGYLDFSDEQVFSDDHVKTAQVIRVRDRMISRGPDDAGVWQGQGIVLGHRRLKIIDLSVKGRQPMVLPDGSLRVVFNGEIYNYEHLRATLQKKGHRFVSNSDTETLLHGYREWGEDLPTYLHGMFAFAIWDNERRRLFLARDRMGKKPLFYWQRGTELWFASSLSAMEPELPELTVDPTAIDHFLRYRFVPDHLCIYREVKRVQPACSITFTAHQSHLKPYWTIQTNGAPPRNGVSLDDAVKRVEEALDQAVLRRLTADVPVGVFLSGGVDSTAVAAFAVRHKPDLRAYHITSRDNDEREYARRVADHLGITLEEIEIDTNSWDRLVEAHSLFGEPFADPAAVTTALVAEVARERITVALSGDGGDEVFAGYSPPVQEMRSKTVRQFVPRRAAAVLAPALEALPFSASARLASALKESMRTPIDRHCERDLLAGFGMDAYNSRMCQELSGWNPSGFYRDRYNELDSGDPIKRLLYADMRTRLVGEFLPKVDVCSMAGSLEVRCPFLDHEVVELGMSLPAGYLVTPFRAKHLLRRLVGLLVPRELVERPKQGFEFPVLRALGGEWGGKARALLREERERLGCWVSSSLLERFVDKAIWRTDDELELAWRLICLALWARTVRRDFAS